MLEAYQALISCLGELVSMFFRLPLAGDISLGSFFLATAILSAVISVIFAGVRQFNMIDSRNRHQKESNHDVS